MDLTRFEREFPPQFLKGLANAIEQAVRRSFVAFPLPIHTERSTAAEWQRRVEWCMEYGLALRREKQATVYEIADTLPRALHLFLLHGECIPNNDRFWAVGE